MCASPVSINCLFLFVYEKCADTTSAAESSVATLFARVDHARLRISLHLARLGATLVAHVVHVATGQLHLTNAFFAKRHHLLPRA